MMRLLLALVALLIAPAASPPAHTTEPEPPSYYSTTIDASAMPGENGWFMIPLYAEQDAWVTVTARNKQITPDSAPWGHAILVAFGDQAVTLSAVALGGYEMIDASVAGHPASCCLQATHDVSRSESTTQRVNGPVTPTRPLFVGLAAAGWGEGSKLEIKIESSEKLQRGAPLVGATTEVVNLVRAANDAGTTLRVGGTTMLGAAGTAERSWTSQGSGVLVTMFTARGEHAARLTLEAPALQVVGLGLRNAYAGYTEIGKGHFGVTLWDIETPPWDPNHPDEGGLFATALYADIALPMTGHDSYHGTVDDW